MTNRQTDPQGTFGIAEGVALKGHGVLQVAWLLDDNPDLQTASTRLALTKAMEHRFNLKQIRGCKDQKRKISTNGRKGKKKLLKWKRKAKQANMNAGAKQAKSRRYVARTTLFKVLPHVHQLLSTCKMLFLDDLAKHSTHEILSTFCFLTLRKQQSVGIHIGS